jgi:hypothetical protein
VGRLSEIVDRDILVMDLEAVYQVVPEDEMTSAFSGSHLLTLRFEIQWLTWVAFGCSIPIGMVL